VYFTLVILTDLNIFRKISHCFLSAPSDSFQAGAAKPDPAIKKEAEDVTNWVALGK